VPRGVDAKGLEDVPYFELAQDAGLGDAFGVPGAINLLAGCVQPVAIVGDVRGPNAEYHSEIFTASATVIANAGDSGLFEFHHPREPQPFGLASLFTALFEFALGNTTGAVKALIAGETTPVTRLVVILDVALSWVSVTNALGPWGGIQWINPGFGSAPVIIDVLPTLIVTGGSYAGVAASTSKAHGRLWAGRRADSSALPVQNNAGAVFGSPGLLNLLSGNTGAQPWRPFGKTGPFVLLPGRGFAIGFGATGAGTQTNVNAACSVAWKEIILGQ
jgi:hypothetical protein